MEKYPIHCCECCENVLIDSKPINENKRSYRLSLETVKAFATRENFCPFFQDLLFKNKPLASVQPNLAFEIIFKKAGDSFYYIDTRIVPTDYVEPKDVRQAAMENARLSAKGVLGRWTNNPVQAITTADDAAASEVYGRVIEPGSSFLSAHNSKLIQGWYMSCINEHKNCPKVSGFVPKRLIAVGKSTETILKLCELDLSSDDTTVSYATMSYVWGGPQQFQTKKDSIERMMSGFNVEELPKTIRDAVFVCRALGIKWLWADVICIIQDDPVDKLQQIVQMGEIYARCALTLIAASATYSNEGFLNATSTNVRLPYQKLAYPCSNQRTGYIYLIERKPGAATLKFATEERGWTYQERLLSPRLLCFSSGRIDWVCEACHLHAGISESWSVGVIDENLTRGFGKFSGNSIDAWLQITNMGDKTQRWFDICHSYSQRKLTVPMDFLPAMSGIAKEFRKAHPGIGDYVAGLWTTGLARSLLWYTSDPSKPSRLEMYRAPSWSWASIQGKIYLTTSALTSDTGFKLEILHHNVEHVAGSDVYGVLINASLSVRGRIKPARWNVSGKFLSSIGLFSSGGCSTLADTLEYDTAKFGQNEIVDVWCLEVQDAKQWRSKFGTNSGTMYTGLLLVAATRPGELAFERVGLFCLAGVKKQDGKNTEVVAAAEKNLCWFDDTEVQELTLI